jgi:hypothetical protein
MIYDNTTIEDGWNGFGSDALAYTWFAGGRLYRWSRWLDKCNGVTSWENGLDWLIKEGRKEPISQIQYWGHGSWGKAWLGRSVISESTLNKSNKIRDRLEELKPLLTSNALIWFRTCSTFGNKSGQGFAKEFTNYMDCRVAAHTHMIGWWQGGLHSLKPNQSVYWPSKEGVSVNSRGGEKALWSSWRTPNTITCMSGAVPKGW